MWLVFCAFSVDIFSSPFQHSARTVSRLTPVRTITKT